MTVVCCGCMVSNVNEFVSVLTLVGSLGSDGDTVGNLASEIMPTEFK